MPASPFEFFGFPHIAVMASAIALPLLLALAVKRLDSELATRSICVVFAAVLLLNDFLNWYHHFPAMGVREFLRYNLPLHVCGITIFAAAATLVLRRQTAYEITYFWGLAGATNAVVTPQLDAGFPHYRFFQYFIVHGGIVAAALFATWGLNMRPSDRSVWRAFLLLNLLAVVLVGVNLTLGSNYLYLCRPPETRSPFFFAPWPWYIPILDAVALGLFYLLYLPFRIRRKAGSLPSSPT